MSEPTSEGKNPAPEPPDAGGESKGAGAAAAEEVKPGAAKPPSEPKAAEEKPDKRPDKEPDKKPAAKKPAIKKPVAKKSKKSKKSQADPRLVRRRRFVWWSVAASLLASFGYTIYFFFPRVLFEPKTRFPIGFPDDYSGGVDTKWQNEKRIWVVKQPGKLFVIFARCTHLGCTPDWKETEGKFKCPCHGSGFDMEGVNFEGPAPQPLLRTAVSLSARGEIIVDKGRLFAVNEWSDPDAFLAV